MRWKIFGPALFAGLMMATGACKTLDEPDLNALSLTDLQKNPTASGIAAATTGLLRGSRTIEEVFVAQGFTELTGEFGREGYALDKSAPLFTSDRLIDLGHSTGGDGVWSVVYRNIRQAAIVINAADGATDFSAAQKNAVKGFAKTIQALDLLMVVDIMDDAGAVTQFDVDPSAPLPPIDTRDNSLKKGSDLLDEGKTLLLAAGSSFPFSVSAGYAGFGAPGSFLTFNRALKARVECYRGSLGGGAANFTAALTALTESFLDPTAPLSIGPAYSFSTNSGDATNPMYVPVTVLVCAHP